MARKKNERTRPWYETWPLFLAALLGGSVLTYFWLVAKYYAMR